MSTVNMLARMLSKQTGSTFTPHRVTEQGKERGFLLDVQRGEFGFSFFSVRPIPRSTMESVLAAMGDMINMGFVPTIPPSTQDEAPK